MSVLTLPAVWTGYLTFHFGVDIPFYDQWEGFYPLLEKEAAGGLRLADFFRFHGPHPMFFPRLVLFGLAKLTHWNTRAEMLVIWLLACVCAVNVWRLAKATRRDGSSADYGSLFAALVLLFTPAQLENWTWGGQVGVLLPVACITACFWIAPAVRVPINFLLTIALSVVCTFSNTGGTVCWVVTFPLLWRSCANLEARRKLGWALLWLVALLVCLSFFVHGYSDQPPESGLVALARHPFSAVQFFLAYLGGAFAVGSLADTVPGRPASFRPSGTESSLMNWASWDAGLVAQLVGALLLAGSVAAAVYLWRCRRDKQLLSQNLPWLMVAFYALLSAAMTTVGRWETGIAPALAGRYLIFSVMLPIGLLFLMPALFKHWRLSAPGSWKPATVGTALSVVAVALALLHAVGTAKILEDWREVQRHRLAGKATLLLVNAVDEPEMLERLTLLPFPPKVCLNLLDRMGYLRPPLVKTNAIRALIGKSSREARQFGEVQSIDQLAGGQMGMAGWSVLPDKRRPADVVLLTYDDAKGESIIFALAEVGMTPPKGVAYVLQRNAYLRSGWDRVFSAERLPPAARTLRAWAFDAEECRAYPIPKANAP